IPQRTLYPASLSAGCVARRNCSFACSHSSSPQKPSALMYASLLRVKRSKHACASAPCPCLRSDQQSAGTAAKPLAADAHVRINKRRAARHLICPGPPGLSPVPAAQPLAAFCSPPGPSRLSGTSAYRSFVPVLPFCSAVHVSPDHLPLADLLQDPTT